MAHHVVPPLLYLNQPVLPEPRRSAKKKNDEKEDNVRALARDARGLARFYIIARNFALYVIGSSGERAREGGTHVYTYGGDCPIVSVADGRFTAQRGYIHFMGARLN